VIRQPDAPDTSVAVAIVNLHVAHSLRDADAASATLPTETPEVSAAADATVLPDAPAVADPWADPRTD
jgi:hypothetical protein